MTPRKPPPMPGAPARFGDRLWWLCRTHRMRHCELAARLGATVQTLGRWIRCVNEPRIWQIVLLAEIFDTTTDFLLGRTNAP